MTAPRFYLGRALARDAGTLAAVCVAVAAFFAAVAIMGLLGPVPAMTAEAIVALVDDLREATEWAEFWRKAARMARGELGPGERSPMLARGYDMTADGHQAQADALRAKLENLTTNAAD